MPTDPREFDITLLGVTGFTGGLIADYLAANAPPSTRIALAGRNAAKLEGVRSRVGDDLALVAVDVTDAQAVRSLAGRTRVVISTVGPY
ncbi:MAG TPA: saccharopine dehydrogenase NADP-binding domain-containing protein, partial [Acidimicrobiales bacterium]|nr:saccharopine dehydrogenase NADP-binding domain-containing protein [Acidimicrobiales bacterium]